MSYLVFEQDTDAGKGKKTKVWDVVSTSDNYLGKIKWYAAWRQYTFWPWPDTIFNKDCLSEIAEFCATETKAHRTA